MENMIDNERIILIDYEEEMQQSYIDYAMSVIIQRALPDVRDGLKPVHRRILYAMSELNLLPDKTYRKSARIVGDTMGKYHPHGDSAIYEAMVRMAQDFSLLHPLVDGHGNFGNIDGDSAAAMRYTEAKLEQLALETLGDMDMGVVDFRDNFDNSLKEPEVLPAKFPNLLVNGSTGIAVGMATNIPSHNLDEVLRACIALLGNDKLTSLDLMKYVKGPDFPTGGLITNPKDLETLYATGKGKIELRAKIEREDAGHGKTNLIITEIPYTHAGSKTKLIETIIDKVKNKVFEEISDVRDESSKEGISIVLEVKRGVNIENLIAKLYKKTKLKDSFSANFLTLVDGEPKVLNLREILGEFLKFQKEINIKKYKYLLDRAEERKEIQEGLIKALDVIDLIIEIMRGSKHDKVVKKCLTTGDTTDISFRTKRTEKEASKLNFTDKQASAILEIKLRKLIGLEVEKLKAEYDQLLKEMDFYNSVLTDEEVLNKIIKKSFETIRKKYFKERKSEITEYVEAEYVEVLMEEELHVLIDRFGYIKTIDQVSYNRCNSDTISEFKKDILINNTDKLCIFDKVGNVTSMKVLDIPNGKIKDRGVPLETVCDAGQDEVLYLVPQSKLEGAQILFVTKKGLMKIVKGSDFLSNRKIVSTKLIDGDELIYVGCVSEDEIVAFITENMMATKIRVGDIKIAKKTSKGIDILGLKEETTLKYVRKIFAEDVLWEEKDNSVTINKLKFNKLIKIEKG